MSRCSGSANGTFVWHSSPWPVPAAAAQPELVGVQGLLGTGTRGPLVCHHRDAVSMLGSLFPEALQTRA